MESQTIEIGQIYRIKADKENDITPKAGWLFRPKFFIGNIAQDDFSNIVKLLRMSPLETYIHLKTFGIM